MTLSGRNFLPHHEPMIRSGSRAITSSTATTRSLAAPRSARSAKMSMPPAISTSSETHPIPEISGSSHSSKNTRGRLGRAFARAWISARRISPPGPLIRIDDGADRPDHAEDPRDAALVEGVDVEPAADQIGGDVGLEVGEGQDEVGRQRQDFVDI